MATAAPETTCYRHPSRETGVKCSRCGRPICPDCMTPTPVGMRCPECSKEKTQVRTLASLSSSAPEVTYVLIAINVLIFIASGQFGIGTGGSASSRITAEGALYGPAIDQGGDYWRLVTSGFLHAGLLHIAFNMFLLFQMGQLLEPAMGRAKFALVYFASLLTGSFGALLFAPDSFTVGASGAIFGLLGAAFFEMRARGIDPMASGIGPLILFNLAFGFIANGSGVLSISIGGHLGGLAGGALASVLLTAVERRRLPQWTHYAVLVAVGVVGIVGSLAVAGSTSGVGGL